MIILNGDSDEDIEDLTADPQKAPAPTPGPGPRGSLKRLRKANETNNGRAWDDEHRQRMSGARKGGNYASAAADALGWQHADGATARLAQLTALPPGPGRGHIAPRPAWRDLLPHFTPVDELPIGGMDPTGAPIHVDYDAMFRPPGWRAANGLGLPPALPTARGARPSPVAPLAPPPPASGDALPRDHADEAAAPADFLPEWDNGDDLMPLAGGGGDGAWADAPPSSDEDALDEIDDEIDGGGAGTGGGGWDDGGMGGVDGDNRGAWGNVNAGGAGGLPPRWEGTIVGGGALGGPQAHKAKVGRGGRGASRGRQKRGGKAVAAAADGPVTPHWVTIGGRKVFVDANGRKLKGKAGFAAYKLGK